MSWRGRLTTERWLYLVTVARYAGYFASLYCAAALFRMNVIDWNIGSGPSMFPTLSPDASLTVVSKLHSSGRNIGVGDIVLAKSPYFLHQRIAKRVIGMPGDFVVHDPPEAVTVGGVVVPGKDVGQEQVREPEMIEVPEGHVWLAGDNLGWSRDSRRFGPLPMALIQGKIIAAGPNWRSLVWHWRDSTNTLKVPDEEFLRDEDKT